MGRARPHEEQVRFIVRPVDTQARGPNNQMQRTVKDKVPKVKRGRPAADLER